MADTIGQFLKHSDTVVKEATQPAPPLGKPAVIPFQPPPPLSKPLAVADEPFQPPPKLTEPQPVPFEPPPPLTRPAAIPAEPAPKLTPTHPADRQPSLPTTPTRPADRQPSLAVDPARQADPQPSETPLPTHKPWALGDDPKDVFSGKFPDVHPPKQSITRVGENMVDIGHLFKYDLTTPDEGHEAYRGRVDKTGSVQDVLKMPSQDPLPIHKPWKIGDDPADVFSGSFPDVHPPKQMPTKIGEDKVDIGHLLKYDLTTPAEGHEAYRDRVKASGSVQDILKMSSDIPLPIHKPWTLGDDPADVFSGSFPDVHPPKQRITKVGDNKVDVGHAVNYDLTTSDEGHEAYSDRVKSKKSVQHVLAMKSSIPEKVHKPWSVNDDPKDVFSGKFPDVHPPRQETAKFSDKMHSDAIAAMGDGGQTSLFESSVSIPSINIKTGNFAPGQGRTTSLSVPIIGGSLSIPSLNPATAPRNLYLAALTEAQIAAAKFGVQQYIDQAKQILTTVTKQQSTLIGLGLDFANTALFGNNVYDRYQRVSRWPDQAIPLSSPESKWYKDASFYYPDLRSNLNYMLRVGLPAAGPSSQNLGGIFTGNTLEERTLPEYTPLAIDLKQLNSTDEGKTVKQKRQSIDNLYLANDPLNPTLKIPRRGIPTVDVIAEDPLTKSNSAYKSNDFLPATIESSGDAKETLGYFEMDPQRASVGSSNSSLPTDDEAYMPLVFTDLRPMRGSDKFRTVYFRPFIKSISESFTPNWNSQNYWGRVDKVATYQSTDRNINLTFQLVAFSENDLMVVYQKLNWLTSMVYPEYRNSQYFSGPVIRMRVGDLFNAESLAGGTTSNTGRGLPGYITNLNFNFDHSNWELLKDRKIPKCVEVSLGFLVLHEFPIGSVKGGSANNSVLMFGGIRSSGGSTPGSTKSLVNVNRFRSAFGEDYINDPNSLPQNSSATGAGISNMSSPPPGPTAIIPSGPSSQNFRRF